MCIDELECPKCGSHEVDSGYGWLYGMEAFYSSCYECGHDFGGDLDDNGKVKDDRGNEP